VPTATCFGSLSTTKFLSPVAIRPNFRHTSSRLNMLNSRSDTNSISLAECNSGTTHKPPIAVNTTIWIKDILATSGNTGTPLAETYPARCHYCQMQILIMLSSIILLIPRGQFLGLCRYCIRWAICARTHTHRHTHTATSRLCYTIATVWLPGLARTHTTVWSTGVPCDWSVRPGRVSSVQYTYPDCTLYDLWIIHWNGCLCAQPRKYKRLRMCNTEGSSLCGGGVAAMCVYILFVCNLELWTFQHFTLYSYDVSVGQ
jgi:hypothetical protein